MSDYIKREDAEYALVSHFMPQTYTGEDVDQAFHLAKSIMSDVPSANVAPVRHGRWVKHEGSKKGVKDSIECSACGVWIDDMPRKTFCPNCGASMDGEENDG